MPAALCFAFSFPGCPELAPSLLRGRTAHTDSIEMPDSRQRVARAAAEMQRNFWRDQTLDSAARVAGLSRRRFIQLFREMTSESWHGRLERLRIAHARHLFTTTTISIWATAFECGYADLAHYYRTFRKVTGQTLAEVRKANPPERLVRSKLSVDG